MAKGSSTASALAKKHRRATGHTPKRRSTTQGARKKRTTIPSCFVIMPFGKKGTDDEQHYNMVYEHVHRRAVEDAGFASVRADEIPESGPIPDTIKHQLRNADLVLADLSDRNPNVFYELGYRHSLGKPSITVSDDVSSIPFNVATYATIQYCISPLADADEARDRITEFARKILKDGRRPRIVAQQREVAALDLLRDLESLVDRGFSNVYHLISDHRPVRGQESVIKDASHQLGILEQIQSRLDGIEHKAEAMVAASKLLQQTSDLGLVNIYATRMDAFEDAFFEVMQREEKGIDVVGSTLFGLKGHHHVTHERVLVLLREKSKRENFRLRLLLTHWDYISHRQDQEKTEKNITRYVISKELSEAVEVLKSHGLTDCVRFYRAAPTCFTVVCRGQGLMLVNPYPYQKEAYNSWTAIFSQTGQRAVYDVFSEAHFDQPWNNDELGLPFGVECEAAVKAKLGKDLREAQQELSGTYAQDSARVSAPG